MITSPWTTLQTYPYFDSLAHLISSLILKVIQYLSLVHVAWGIYELSKEGTTHMNFWDILCGQKHDSYFFFG